MKKFRLLQLLLIGVFVTALSLTQFGCVTPSKPSLRTDPSISSGTLSNGMSYFIQKNEQPANRIFLRLVVKAGSILEDDDQKGVAHLVEHMAFNGTKQFAKNELVSYFQSIGMKFGPEVNASTSFDETIYMLEIPADKPEILETSLNVLKDWASGITFDAEELDKERGVVLEEWRLGRGANGRIADKQIPFLLTGSRYAQRLAIGDPEIIRTVSRERVIDFYTKWYRPDLMTVVVVGAIDTKEIVKNLENTVGSIPPANGAAERKNWNIEIQKKSEQIIIRDPEVPFASVHMFEHHNALQLSSKEALRENIIISIAITAFNQRLKEKTTVSEPSMLAAQSSLAQFARPTIFSAFSLVPETGRFAPALEQAITELLRLQKFGITDSELERGKQSILQSTEQSWINRSKITSSSKASSIVQQVIRGHTALSIDDRFAIYKEIIPTITVADVSNAIAKYWLDGRGSRLVVIAPTDSKEVPTDNELQSLWRDWKPNVALTPYSEANLDRPLVKEDRAPAGKIVAEKVVLELPGGKDSPSSIKEWTLSNGARVLLCPTKFKTDEILISAWSPGGYLMVSDSEYPSIAASRSFREASGLNGFSAVELKKKLAGKTVNAVAWIEEAYEGLWGTSSTKDIETLFQLINLQMTAPYFSDEGWGSLYAQAKKVAETRAVDPNAVFDDLKVRLLYGNNIRRSTLTPAYVAQLDKKISEATSRARYENAGDFTFVIVGSFEEKDIRPLVETWIAALPSTGEKETAKSLDLSFPKGIVKDHLSMGIEPKSKVFLGFGGNTVITDGELELFGLLRQLLEIRLLEVIREDSGGTYGASVRSSMKWGPSPYYELSISFGCEPGREQELADQVLKVAQELRDAPVDESYITKLREGLIRSREKSLRSNNYWLEKIVDMGKQGRPLSDIADTDAIVNLITAQRMQELAIRYLKTDNYVQAHLEPAKN